MDRSSERIKIGILKRLSAGRSAYQIDLIAALSSDIGIVSDQFYKTLCGLIEAGEVKVDAEGRYGRTLQVVPTNEDHDPHYVERTVSSEGCVLVDGRIYHSDRLLEYKGRAVEVGYHLDERASVDVYLWAPAGHWASRVWICKALRQEVAPDKQAKPGIDAMALVLDDCTEIVESAFNRRSEEMADLSCKQGVPPMGDPVLNKLLLALEAVRAASDDHKGLPSSSETDAEG